MGFFTSVDDLKRKNALIAELLFGNLKLVTIATSWEESNLEPLNKLYEDRECFELTEYAKDFNIDVQIVPNPDGRHNATLSFIRK